MDTSEQKPFQISYLDHVALLVTDLAVSVRWYEEVFGLEKFDPEVWGGVPVFMRAGETGLALFPADSKAPRPDMSSKFAKLDHFAFRVEATEFQKARAHFEDLGLEYVFKDHVLFHSLYLKDPDGHTAELTTAIPAEGGTT